MIEIILLFVVLWLVWRSAHSAMDRIETDSAAVRANSERARYENLAGMFIFVTGIDPPTLFHVACKEMGFGWSETDVNRHFHEYLETGKFPTYVWSFLDREEQEIKANYPKLSH